MKITCSIFIGMVAGMRVLYERIEQTHVKLERADTNVEVYLDVREASDLEKYIGQAAGHNDLSTEKS